MLRLLRLLLVLFSRFFRSRRDLVLENLALRQQLSVLERRHPRPRIAAPDKLFWVMLRRLWAGWKSASIFVQPETVVYRCLPLSAGIGRASSYIGRGFGGIGLVWEENA
jgi:hypothetical protein